MAAETQMVEAGFSRSTITAAETNQLKDGQGRIHSITVSATGVPVAVITVYDHASADTNPVAVITVAAVGTTFFPLDMPMGSGIRIVTTTMTTTTVTAVWS